MKSENKNLTQLCKDLGITESEAKARFFALYLHQRVLKRAHLLQRNSAQEVIIYANMDNDYLELTDLLDITNEDRAYIKTLSSSSNPSISFRQTIDFLRSRGYVTEWMNLSIEDLITLGWVRIRK